MTGQNLGSFHIEGKLGSGAMGEVFRATQTLKNGQTRQAAVKIINNEFALRDNALNRFQREADILSQLRHPNIVRYFAHGKFKGTWYYAMEFVPGKTLDDLIREREFLPWKEAVGLGIQLAEALHYAHQHQVVHRDLKPSNLMITVEGQLKLTDFGIAKDLDATEALTKTGRTLGTAAYMAPEQIKGTPAVSHKTDLYALGCLLYEMLVGQPPFNAKSAVALMHAHISEAAPRVSAKNPDLPKALDDLILQLMSKDPVDRPWDAQQVSHLLEQMKEKADRGESLPMVFDKARAALAAEKSTEAGRRKPGPATRGDRTSSGRLVDGKKARGGLNRRVLETAGLLAVLIGLTGVLAYVFWPPGQEYLYEHAAKGMESGRRADWRRAEQQYMAPLDRRFPEHPYKEQLSAWRDKIALNDASERALRLEGTGLGSRPLNVAEEFYQSTERATRPFLEREQPGLAWGEWDRYVAQLEQRADPDERGWLLLGSQKKAELEAMASTRRESAARLVDRAKELATAGEFEAALGLLQQVAKDNQNSALGDPALTEVIKQASQILESLKSALPGEPDGPPPGDLPDAAPRQD